MTLDNYIMESEINDATVGDIYVEQALAEMEVAYALASSYTKDAMFVEYMAELYGVDVIQEGYYQEADDDEKVPFKERMAKLGERAKNLGGKIKEAPGKAWEFIKKVASAIATAVTNFWHFITEKSLKSCIKKLENMELSTSFSVPVYFTNTLPTLIKQTDNFVDKLQKMIGSFDPQGSVAIKAPNFDEIRSHFTPDGKAYSSAVKGEANMKHTVMVEAKELLQTFKDLQGADITGRIKRILKSVKEIQKQASANIKQANKNDKELIKSTDDKTERKDLRNQIKDATKETKKINSESLKAIKETAKIIIKAYSQQIRDYRTIANMVLKDEKVLNKARNKFNKSTAAVTARQHAQVPGAPLGDADAKDWENANTWPI